MLRAEGSFSGGSESPAKRRPPKLRFGGGFKPKKVEGGRLAKPSALCPSSAASSAFQGGSLGKNYHPPALCLRISAYAPIAWF
jgi:hypothetical protein